jgi:hypothetical protein
MTTFINQKTYDTGCGIAAYAMCTGIRSYGVAEKLMQANDWILDNGHILTTEMKQALEHHFGKGSVKLHYSKPKTGKGVLFVKYNESCRHWIYFEDGLYYDPLPRFSKPRKSIPYPVTRAFSIVT